MMYREDFEKLQCEAPGCECSSKRGDGLVLSALCHPGAGCRVVYRPGSNALDIRCKACGNGIAVVAVASGSEGN